MRCFLVVACLALFAAAAPARAPAANGLPGAIASASPAPSATPATRKRRATIEVYSEYDSRYADFFNNVTSDAELGSGTFVPYAALDVDYDTRSGVPGLADVYNDNAVVPRIGYRTALDRNHFSDIFATVGYSFGLRSQLSFPWKPTAVFPYASRARSNCESPALAVRTWRAGSTHRPIANTRAYS
jgi:hypothetical protein